MAVHRIQSPDGQIYRIEAPAGATDEDLFAFAEQEMIKDYQIQQLQAQRRQDAGMLENLLTGVGQGFTGMLESAALGGATLLPEEEELAARKRIQGIASLFTPEGGDPESILNKVGQAGGSFAAFLPTMLLGPGAIPAATALAAGAGAGEASERARAAGVPEDVRTKSALEGAAIGLLDVIPYAGIAGKFGVGVKTPLVGDLIKKLGSEEVKGMANRLRRAAITGTAEGVQEATTEVLQNLVERGYRPEKELVEGLGEAGTIGFGAGAAVQALIDLVIPNKYGQHKGNPTKTGDKNVDTVLGDLPSEQDIRRRVWDELEQQPPPPPQEPPPPPPPPPTRTDLEQRQQAWNELERTQRTPEQTQRQQAWNELERTQREQDVQAQRQQAWNEMEQAPQQPPAPPQITPEQKQRRKAWAELEQAPQEEIQQRQQVLQKTITETNPAAENIKFDQKAYNKTFTDALEAEGLPQRELTTDERRTLASALVLQQERRRQAWNDLEQRRVEEPTVPPPTTGQEANVQGIQPEPAATGVGVESAGPGNGPVPVGVTGREDTGRAGGAEPGGLAVTGVPATGAEVRAVAEPDTLTETQQARKILDQYGTAVQNNDIETQQTLRPLVKEALENLGRTPEAQAFARELEKQPKKETQAPLAEPKPPKQSPAQQQVEESESPQMKVSDTVAYAFLGKVAPEHLHEMPKIRANRGQRENLQRLVTEPDMKEPARTATPEERDAFYREKTAQRYLKRYETLPRALDIAIYEKVHKVPEHREQAPTKGEPMTPTDIENQQALKAHYEGTGGKHAQRMIDWAIENGYNVQPFIDSVTRYYERQYTNQARRDVGDTKRKLPNLAKLNKTARDLDAAIRERMKRAGDVGDREVMERTRRIRAEAQRVVGKPETKKLSKEQTASLKQLMDELGELPLVENAIDSLDIEMHPNVVDALRRGKLRQALISLEMTAATEKQYKLVDSDVAVLQQLARRFVEVMGTTKVKVVPNLRSDITGKLISGRFEPRENTIYIRKGRENSAHVLLHEVAHALTIHTLRTNKSHKITKQIQKLFNETRRQLRSEYGATNVEEFVAEAYSNPSFQRQLARIIDKEGLTAWEKFVDSITSFVWKLLRNPRAKDTTTYAEFRDMMDTLLAPAPEFANHNAFEMAATKGTLDDVRDGMATRYRQYMTDLSNTHAARAETIDDIVEFLGRKVPKKLKQAFLYTLPSFPLGEITKARYGLNHGNEMHKLFMDHQGDTRALINEAEATLSVGTDFAKASPEQMKILDDLHIRATEAEVDPDRPRSDYKNDADKLKIWDAMRPDWNKLGKDGQAVYREFRESYRKLGDMMDKSLMTRIQDLVEDKPTADKLISEYLKEVVGKRIDPYFPLTREGKGYWLYYEVEGESMPSYKTFPTSEARERFVIEAKKDPAIKSGSVRYADKLQDFKYESMPPTSFVNNILQAIKASKLKVPDGPEFAEQRQLADEQVEQVMRLFIARLPETAYAKATSRRAGYGGADKDIILGYRRRAFPMARQIVGLQYSKRMQAKLQELNAEIKGAIANNREGPLAQEGQMIWDEWSARARFAFNPPNDWQAHAARNANRFAFVGTLGFNVSSAAIQTMQIPMFAYPYLAAKTGSINAAKNIKNATKLFMGSPTDFLARNLLHTQQRKVKGTPLSKSISNYYQIDNVKVGDKVVDTVWKIRDDLDIDAKTRDMLQLLSPLAKRLHDSAQDSRSIHYETLEVEEFGPKTSLMDKMSMVSAYLFHHAERMNRQVIATSSFLTELQRLESDPTDTRSREAKIQDAVDVADRETQQLNGGNLLSTAPRLAQKSLGRVAFMFKGYGVSMYYHIIKTGLQAFDKLPSAERTLARKQFFGTLGMIGLMSGASGLPFYSAIMELINLFREDDELDADAIVRTHLNSLIYSGVIDEASKVLGGEGLSISHRIGLSNVIIQSNRFDFDPSVEKTIVTSLGGPFYGYLSSIGRGYNDLREGNWERGLESVLPAAFRNAWKGAVRYPREGALTRRKNPIMQELTPGLMAAQAFGFAPAEYIRNQERNQILKGIDRAVNEKRTKLLRKLYIEMYMGANTSDTMKEIAKFNQKWPQHAITPSSMKSSMKKHTETTMNMHDGVLFTPAMRPWLNQLSQELEM